MAETFDVAIVGGGPAGLCAALFLGRSRRRVVVCDHGQPRNYAAKAVHGFLGLDGVAPRDLRARGRDECAGYGISFIDDEVKAARRIGSSGTTRFELQLTNGSTLVARKVLLATGVKDELPDISGMDDYYGTSVHHCPYCDGWEHRDRRLVALGKPDSAGDLALMLRNWSSQVTVVTNGQTLAADQKTKLSDHGVEYRETPVRGLEGTAGKLERVIFASGGPLACDALFFSAGHAQRSALAEMLGCEYDDKELVESSEKQRTCVPGVFIAGDADGEVQFAIVAAAEGATAAVVINRELMEEDLKATSNRDSR